MVEIETAIEHAIDHIQEKGEKIIQKKLEKVPTRKSGSWSRWSRKHLQGLKAEQLLRSQLEEGKMSPLLLRRHSISDVYPNTRRTGVSERNETERLLVKEVLKHFQKEERTINSLNRTLNCMCLG